MDSSGRCSQCSPKKRISIRWRNWARLLKLLGKLRIQVVPIDTSADLSGYQCKVKTTACLSDEQAGEIKLAWAMGMDHDGSLSMFFFWRSTTSSFFVNMAVVHLRMSKATWNPPSICRIYRLPLSIFHDAQTPGLDTYRHIPSPMDPLGKEPPRDDKVRSCFCRNSCDIHVIIGKSHGIMDNHNR